METLYLSIRTPIWKTESVGIAERKLKFDNIIDISYRLPSGKRLYPYLYSISKEKALTYPIQRIGRTKLRIVPIKDFKIVGTIT